jgi:putative transposase
MPRFARVVVPHCPHHITQRGNVRRDIFFTPDDRRVYLGLLKQYADLYQLEVLGYCLMTNHVHLVLIPATQPSLPKAMREINMRYAQYRNAIERGNGHLWQSRYYSCPVEPARLGTLMRYVELNPVRAGMVPAAALYDWSSARVHLGGENTTGTLALVEWKQSWTAEDWAQILASGGEEAGAIREATYGGRPLGSNQFVQEVETFLCRRLQRGAPGRPQKHLTQHHPTQGHTATTPLADASGV